MTTVELRHAIRDGLADTVAELRELRHVIAQWVALDLEAQRDATADGDQSCTHPAERRTDFGVTRGQADWVCQCGFRSVDTEVRA